MKFLSALLLASFFAMNVQAKPTGWICTALEQDLNALERLELPGYLSSIGVLTIAEKECRLSHSEEFEDACKVGAHSVFIFKDTTFSMLVSKNRKQRFGLNCQRQEADVEDSRLPQNSEHDGPSHGGGN